MWYPALLLQFEVAIGESRLASSRRLYNPTDRGHAGRYTPFAILSFEEVEYARPCVNQWVGMAVVPVPAHDLVKELESTEKDLDRLMCLVGFEHQEKSLPMLAYQAMKLVNQVIFDRSPDALRAAFPALASAHLPDIGFQVGKKGRSARR